MTEPYLSSTVSHPILQVLRGPAGVPGAREGRSSSGLYVFIIHVLFIINNEHLCSLSSGYEWLSVWTLTWDHFALGDAASGRRPRQHRSQHHSDKHKNPLEVFSGAHTSGQRIVVDPEHSGDITYLVWPGSVLGSSWRSWRRLPGRRTSWLLTQSAATATWFCMSDRKQIAGWMTEYLVLCVCLFFVYTLLFL